MSDELFLRKRALCEQVLKVFDKIMPGRNRKRGKSWAFWPVANLINIYERKLWLKSRNMDKFLASMNLE